VSGNAILATKETVFYYNIFVKVHKVVVRHLLYGWGKWLYLQRETLIKKTANYATVLSCKCDDKYTHIRREINKSNLPNTVLAERHKVSLNTVSKWKKRNFVEDVSSRPHNIEYALTAVQEALVVSIRNTTWASR